MEKFLKKITGTFLLTCIAFSAFGQHMDQRIDMGIYKSYYSFSIREPLYVTYTLRNGGGSCDRNVEHFSFTPCGVQTATDDDYSGTVYDKGHLANAEDFASSCTLEKKTFCYFNCFPQTTKLNRGIWKTWETRIRAMSQSRTLFVIAGGIYTGHQLKPGSQVIVPDSCYKIVLDAVTKEILICKIFPNDSSGRVSDISLESLKQKLGYPLVP